MASYRFLDFELSEGEFCLIRGGQRIALEPKALRVLTLLVRRAGHLVDKRELLESVWPNSFVEENTLTRTITILRRELGDSSRDSKIIETVPTRGYRFIAPVTALEEESRTATANSEALIVSMIGRSIGSESGLPSQPPGLRLLGEQQDQTPVAEIVSGQRNWASRKWLLVGAVSALVLAGVTTYTLTRRRPADAKAPKITSLAVLPLKNLSGDPAQEYFADGMTEEVIGRLSMIRGLRVISRTSVMQFKDTRLSTPEIARKLGVDALVEGSVMREGNRIRVHAQLIRASTDEHFWSESYDRELGDVLTLESEVAQSIAQSVEVTVSGEERARLVTARSVSPEVYEDYLKGLAAQGNSMEEVEKQIALFDEAIRKDPTFAPSYVGLAGAYASLGTVFVGASPAETRPKVISAAQKALELDPELADAHVELANIYMREWNWTEAEAEYRRALDLNPNDAVAHDGLSDWLLCHGRMEEA
ncbi:MAG: winged helix-turn-helix domain-containing protein, partial [Terracidiphilus sp.]